MNPSTKTSITTLIAEDEALAAESLAEWVRSMPQLELLAVCADGASALAQIRALRPELVLMDIQMPGLTGLEVLQEIRKENTSLKFIILTFHATEYYRQKAFSSGTDYFFSKVDDFEKVSQVIEELAMKRKNSFSLTHNKQLNN